MTAEEVTQCKKAIAVLKTFLSGICQAVDIDEDTEMRVKSHDETLIVVSIKDALKLGDDALVTLNQTTLC